MQIIKHKPVQWMTVGFLAILIFIIGIEQFEREPAALKNPCMQRISFHVGVIDERFSITPIEVSELMKEVAEVWSAAADTTIIVYDEQGEISVNLVYEEEQQLTDRERQFRDQLEHKEFTITVLENEYKRLNNRYAQDVNEYDEDSEKLQESINRLNEWVRQKNEQGGFNELDLEQFEARKSEIDRFKNDLSYRELTLKRMADEINEKITFLNNKIEAKNRMIDEYNREFTGTRKFTQGAYEWTNNSKTINIYHFLDKNELRLVLAHEIGHALGLGHVSNPKSVMHELMVQQNKRKLELTQEDIQALNAVCRNNLN